MSEDALTGFLAWLEAAPPGQRVNVGLEPARAGGPLEARLRVTVARTMRSAPRRLLLVPG